MATYYGPNSSLYNKPRLARTILPRSLYGRSAPYGTGGVTHPLGINSGVRGSLAGISSGSSSSSSGYPAFADSYSELLNMLASRRQSDLGMLKGNLTGREEAIRQLYAGQNPLIEANYGKAIKESAAVNDAVLNQLKGEGSAAKADLLSRLSLINAPGAATDKATGDLSQYYSGLGGANYAMDQGDVQRLIGRQAEEKEYAQKQPAIVAQELEAQYAQDVADLLAAYSEQEFGIRQDQASARNEYTMNKFEYETGQKQQEQERLDKVKEDAVNRYWENYWKRQELLQRRWEIAVASRDKKAANKIKVQMEREKAQAQQTVAGIRSATTIEAANIAAGARVESANIAASAKTQGGAKAPNSAALERARKNALAAVLRPDGLVRYLVKYGDTVVMKKINAAIRAAGIDPTSNAGKNIFNYVMSTISGREIVGGNGTYVRPGKRKPKKGK